MTVAKLVLEVISDLIEMLTDPTIDGEKLRSAVTARLQRASDELSGLDARQAARWKELRDAAR